MTGPRSLSLAHLSSIETSPHDLVTAAFRAGFDAVGLRVTRTTAGIDHGLLHDASAARRLHNAIADCGLSVLDVEVIRLRPEGPDPDPGPVLELGRLLGARHVITVVEDEDLTRAVDGLRRLVQQAAALDLEVVLEPMVFSAVRSLTAARNLISAVGESGLGLLGDTLHLVRSGAGPGDLRAIPAGLVRYMQVCGANGSGTAGDPASARKEAVTDRLPPDEGDLPVRALVDALPPTTPLSVECPTRRFRGADPELVARALHAATLRMLAEAA